MSSEREIIKKLHEASFTSHGSTYSCVFGRYSKDGKSISRDEYFKAKEKVSPTEYKRDERVTDEDIISAESEYDDLPEYLYHATFYKYLDSIASSGLGNKSKRQNMSGSDYGGGFYSGNGIFLATNPDEALEYVSTDERGEGDDVVLLRIPKSALSKDKIYYDTNNETTNDYLSGDSDVHKDAVTYFYNDIIEDPQSKVEIVD